MNARSRRFLSTAVLGFVIATLAAAQTSSSFRMLSGGVAVTGGSAASSSFRLLVSAGTAIASGRATSTNFRLNGGVVLTDVPGGDGSPPQTPTSVQLLQNYPNPFNPATTISYELPRRSTVRITVTNALGETVRTIDEGEREAGTHRVLWDGRNDSGIQAPSGAYYYQLSAGDTRYARKMILIR